MLYAGKLDPAEIVAGCVAIYEDAFPSWQQAIAVAEEQAQDSESSCSWSRAETIGSGIYQDRRTNMIMGITDAAEQGNAVMRQIHNQTYLSIVAATNDYGKRFKISETFHHEPYGMLKYRGGQMYGSHHDAGINVPRSVSAVVYLNEDYEGGEIEFVNFGIKIKPLPGMLILFPSNFAYEHVAHPVTKGTKYAIVTWLREVN